MDFYNYHLGNVNRVMPIEEIEIIGPYNKIANREPILGDYIITRVYVGNWCCNSYGKVVGFNKDEKNEIIELQDGGDKSKYNLSYEKNEYVVIEQDRNLTRIYSNDEVMRDFPSYSNQIIDYPPMIGGSVIVKIDAEWYQRRPMKIGKVESLDENNKKAIVSFGKRDYAFFYDDLLVILDDDCYRLSNKVISENLLKLGINKSRLEDCEISNVEFFNKRIIVKNCGPKKDDLVISRECFGKIGQASIGKIISLDEEKKIAKVKFQLQNVIVDIKEELKYDDFAVIKCKIKNTSVPLLENHELNIPNEIRHKNLVKDNPNLFDDVITRLPCGEYPSNSIGKITDIKEDEIVVEINETQFILNLSEVAIFSH